MIIGPMTLEETRKYVKDLRELEEFHRSMVLKYGSSIAKNSYERVCEITKQLQGYSNIHTISAEDFQRFARGDFGFI